ncbi:MAG: four helix bundle protein [Balneolaceae bacterium]|nr:four helix bundle protein [Balneolaceae bacterium]MCH8550215.1 four helix bundle protein [Balneolaceae bacterium]
MSTAKRFEDLEIWQKSRELVNQVYLLSNRDRFSRDFGLKDQLRRASVSVMNNVSEGFESHTVKLFINYLGRAKASCGETRSMLYVALDQKYIEQKEFETLYNDCSTISGKIMRLIQYLETVASNDRVRDIEVKYDVG